MTTQIAVKDFRKIKIQQVSMMQNFFNHSLLFCHLFLIISILVLF